MTHDDPTVIRTLREWLIDQAAQAAVGAENPSGGSLGDTEAAFDKGARHMAEATLTWIGEHIGDDPLRCRRRSGDPEAVECGLIRGHVGPHHPRALVSSPPGEMARAWAAKENGE